MGDMNAEERIAELEAKVAELLAEKAAWQGEAKELREQLAHTLAQIGQLLARVHELEGRLAKDSHSSSKPPSSDGLARKTRSQREASGKKSGGQPGHEGHHLKLVETPDEVTRHRPSHCQQCQQSLEGVEGEIVERRQVQDLPPVRLVVAEHQVEEVRCPHCQQMSRGSFPEGVSAPAQYGTGVKALAVYLHQYQLVSMERTAEVLQDVCGCRISEGTLVSWEQEAASRLEPTVEQIAERVACSRLQHADETGMRLGGKLHWIHVNSTRFLTHLAWHKKRGRPPGVGGRPERPGAFDARRRPAVAGARRLLCAARRAGCVGGSVFRDPHSRLCDATPPANPGSASSQERAAQAISSEEPVG